MNKKSIRLTIISSVFVLLPIFIGIIFWNQLPAHLATHWGVDGQVNGWSGKAFAVFGFPLILLVVHLLCIFLAMKDPNNSGQNRKVMGFIFWICPVTSIFAWGTIYATAFNQEIHGGSFLFAVLGILFMVLGNYLPKCKRNYTIGVKIKWTLESDENWAATHRFTGKLWVILGLIMILGIFLPEKYMIIALTTEIFVAILVPMVYSYIFYRKQKKNGTLKTSPLPKKITGPLAIVLTVATLVVVAGMMFTGEISYQYDDSSFTIKASFWHDMTVDYDAIEDIKYLDQCSAGVRTNGYGSATLTLGAFRNDEFGTYTRYAYSKCKSCVVIDVDGKILLVNGESVEETKEIYEELLERID